MGYTQRTQVYVADKVEPRNEDLWRALDDEQRGWFVSDSDGYNWQQGNGAGKWYGEQSDMQRLSEQFPGVLFVSDSLGKPDGARWRFFAFDGRTEKVSPELTWPEPLKLGLPPKVCPSDGCDIVLQWGPDGLYCYDCDDVPDCGRRKPDEQGITRCPYDGCDNGLRRGTRDGVAGLFCCDCDRNWVPRKEAVGDPCRACGRPLKANPYEADGPPFCPKCDETPF